MTLTSSVGEKSNFEELKSLVMTQMEQSGAMAELKALVRTQVLAATTNSLENTKSRTLKDSESGVLMLSVCLEFLESFGLTRSAKILRAEADFDAPVDRLAISEDLNVRVSSGCVLEALISSAPQIPEEIEEESIEADMARLRSLNAEIEEEISKSKTSEVWRKFDFSPEARLSQDEERVRIASSNEFDDDHFEQLSDISSN